MNKNRVIGFRHKFKTAEIDDLVDNILLPKEFTEFIDF